MGTSALATAPDTARLGRSGWSWVAYQAARDPYVILIMIYVFAPYFSSIVVGNGARGQSAIANIGVVTGVITALSAPLLGAIIDAVGRRKPWLAAITALMVVLLVSLWWVKPGGGVSPFAASAVLVTLAVLFGYNGVLFDSLLPIAVAPSARPVASGMGLAAGNAAAVILLVFVLVAFVLPGKVALPFVPTRPLFGLDAGLHEPERIVGPLTALVFAVGAIPLFLFTPDARRTALSLRRALGGAVGELRDTVLSLRSHRQAAVFLTARMLYTDAMTALLLFGGVYAAGMMHWGVFELLCYGLILCVFAVVGGIAASWLDTRLGSVWAIRIEIAGTLVCESLVLGISPTRIFYFWPVDIHAAPVWSGPVFRTAPELALVGVAIFAAVFVVGSYASSRTLLTRLAPPERMAGYFGLFALSGTATAWLGSLLVKLATDATHSQRVGLAPIIGLLALGLAGMFMVRDTPANGQNAVSSNRSGA